MLLFRGTDWHKELSPDQIQQIMGRWNDWVEGLRSDGRFVAGNPLENEGCVLTSKTGSVADGPFTESKETVGGYFLLNVDTMEEAIAIGQQCPALGHGIIVEVRPVAPACPVERMVDEVSAHATA